jgi:hypothetical protein
MLLKKYLFRKPVALRKDFSPGWWVTLLFFMVILLSCEDVIEVKLSSENPEFLGVEASITTRSSPEVFLYKTLRVNQDIAYPGISGAEVVVSDNSVPPMAVRLTEDPKKKGWYSVPANSIYPGLPGREYTVTIRTQGVTLTAKDRLTRVEPIDSIQILPSSRGNNRFLGIFTYGKETGGLGNYYKWDVFVNDTLLNDANRMAVASDEFVDGNYIAKLEIFTDFHDPDKPEDRQLKLNDTVCVRQTSISGFAYNFYFQMINQSSTGFLFSVPPANIQGNFTASDGKPVLGVFTARDVSVSNKVVIDKELEDQLKK